MSVLERAGELAESQNRRHGIDRRAGDRRAALRASPPSGGVQWTAELRRSERRCGDRRVDRIPLLSCPDCVGALRHEPALSWSLPGTYTVDAGFCSSCARYFLRNRETGEYDELAW